VQLGEHGTALRLHALGDEQVAHAVGLDVQHEVDVSAPSRSIV
jgi:hypothetical protein